MKEIPKLKDAYDKVVIAGSEKTNEQFWDEFLKKNMQFKTEIFKGMNPVFIPYSTNEKEYEDRYIHNQALILEGDETQTRPRVQLDVDFVRNMGMFEMPSGYGTYQSNQEIAAELDREPHLKDVKGLAL